MREFLSKHTLLRTLFELRGNPRACVYTEPMWGLSMNLCLPYANNAVFFSPSVSNSKSSTSVNSLNSLISNGASLAPQDTNILFAVFPVTQCQGLFSRKDTLPI